MMACDMADLLSRHRFRFSSEEELQSEIAQTLAAAGLSFVREAVMGARDRLDFLVEQSVAVEVKIGGPLSALTRQIFRYAKIERVSAIVVATNRLALTRLPGEMLGKPIHVAYLPGRLA
jgi:hypothetical protein